MLDPATAGQLHKQFEWLVSAFDSVYFQQSTVLVQPTREYFPDRTNNELDMTKALCARILKYAGLTHWPITLVSPQVYTPKIPPLLNLTTSRHIPKSGAELQPVDGVEAKATALASDTYGVLELSYSSAMIKKPMDLVGSMSKNIAQHYLYQSQLALPLGPESFDATSEILAIYLGFGIIIANSAYTFRGSCAKCYDPRANRAAALSEDEAIYCLALFCHYKKIDNKTVTPTLKDYLRRKFKAARKQVANYEIEASKSM